MSKKVIAILATDTMTEQYRCYGPYKRLDYSWHNVKENPKFSINPGLGVLTLHRVFFPNARDDYVEGTVKAIENFQRIGYKVVTEFDDDFTTIPIFLSGYWTNHLSAVKATEAACRASDAVLVSTPYLANKMSKYNPNTKALENCIDPMMWKNRPTSGIGIMGSTSHIMDWKEVPSIWDIVHKEYPDEVLKVVGLDHPWFKFEHTINQGSWRELPNILDFSIGLAPLEETEFNRSKCVVGSTLLVTSLGIIPIEKLVTHRIEDCLVPIDVCIYSNSRSAMATFGYYGGTQETVKVKTKNGRTLEGTLDHRIMNTSGEWVRLDTISIGDMLPITKTLFSKNYITVPVNCWISNRKDNVADISHNHVPQVVIDEVWGSILGYIVGDGYIGRNGIRITCDNKDADVIEDIHTKLISIGAGTRLVDYSRSGPNDVRNCTDVVAGSRTLVEFLNSLGMVRDKRKYIRVPSVILESPKSVVRSFLQALFETDGTVSLEGSASFTTKEEILAKQIQLLLTGFDIDSHIRDNFNKLYQKNYYTVYLNRQACDEFYKNVGFIGKRKSDILLKRVSKPHSNAFKKSKWEDMVVGLERSRNEVFDVTVPDLESYDGDGIVNHNSNCKFLEYTMAGAVTVAQKCLPYTDVIVHGVNGFLAKNLTEFADYVIMLNKDENLRKSILTAARSTVLKQYNIDVNYVKWGEFYQSL